MSAAEPDLVGKGKQGRDGVERQVVVLTEPHEAAQGLRIMAGRTVPPHFVQLADVAAKENERR